MDDNSSPFSSQEEPDALLARLQDKYVRQRRLFTAQKQKQADIELQATAAYYSDLPITLELLSDQTASLFTELEHLIESKQDSTATASKKVLLLQRIRAAVNRELRQSMSFIEEGYQSGFEKLLRQSRVEGRHDSLSAAPKASPALPVPTTSDVVPTTTSLGPLKETQLTVQEALSTYVSLVAESLAVLLQCETVRIYLYDEHGNLRCTAQFPYRACRADPSQSSSLALMTVREVHQTVCRDHLAVNGTVASPAGAPSTISHSPKTKDASLGNKPTGVEDIHSCLIFPLLASSGAGKSYGMIHAVNKHFPSLVDVDEKGTEAPLRGFSLEDEVLVSNVARLLGTTLSRYPDDAFTNVGIGESIRRRAYPGDAQVFSLSAHLVPSLDEEVEEAAEVAKEALNRTLPTLVYRAPVNTIFSRSASETRRRSISATGDDHDASVSTVAFRLRCINELWASSRDDNTALHQRYRSLEDETQKIRLLLRNVLDGVATARAMRISAEVAQYLQTLEVYGRSERTERLAAFVADKMLTLSQQKSTDIGAESDNKLSVHASPAATAGDFGVGAQELRRLQHDHARLNTVTVSSLHYDGPDGVPSYTSAPAQKREQVRFIDELRRSGTNGVQQGAATAHTPIPQNSLPHLAKARTTRRASQRETYPFQRPFKL